MQKGFLKDYVYPIAVLAAGSLGVGFLALPYVAMRSGVWLTALYFIVLTTLVLFLNLAAGKVSLKTPDFKRWPGFVEWHFGRRVKMAVLLPMVLGYIGVLLAYLVVGSQFLSDLFTGAIGIHQIAALLLFWIVSSMIIYFGVGSIAEFMIIALCLLVAAAVIAIGGGLGHLSWNNLIFFALPQSANTIFLPYGVLMFSLWGSGLIPEAEEMLIGRKHLFLPIIRWATLLVAAFYAIFTFAVLGITGALTTQTALPGLAHFLPVSLAPIAVLIGLLAAFVAFVAQGLLLKKTFEYDLNINSKLAWLLTCVPPLLLFLRGARSFVDIVSFTGGFLISLEGILILLMYRKIGGHAAVVYPLILLFALAMIYSVIYL